MNIRIISTQRSGDKTLDVKAVDDGFKFYYAWDIKDRYGKVIDTSESRNYTYDNAESAEKAGLLFLK